MLMLGKLCKELETETGISSLQACTVSSAERITTCSSITIPVLPTIIHRYDFPSGKSRSSRRGPLSIARVIIRWHVADHPCGSLPLKPPLNILNTARLEALPNSSELAHRWPRVSMPLGLHDSPSDRQKVGHGDDSISTDAHPTSRECLMVCVAPAHRIPIQFQFPRSAVSTQYQCSCAKRSHQRLEETIPSGASGSRYVALRVFELAAELADRVVRWCLILTRATFLLIGG
jgi:hypothetical protein